MATAGASHDITISDAGGGNKKGFMLMRDGRRMRRARITDAETIRARFLTENEAREADTDPKIRQRWASRGWEGGVGGFDALLHNKWLSESAFIDSSRDGFLRPSSALLASTVDGGETGPTENRPSGASIVGTELWLHVGRDLFEWSYTGLDLVNQDTPVAAAVTYKNGVEHQGDTFVPCWNTADDTPNRYIHKADADASWTRIGSGTGDSYLYFAKTRNSDDQEILVGGNEGTASPHTIRTSTDATSLGNWSSQTEIGDSDSAITALIAGPQNELLIAKTNGLWALRPSGEVRNILPEFEFQVHPDNFKGAHNWNGHILLPLGTGGMYALIGTDLINVSLEKYAPKETQWHGRVCAVHGNGQRLYILVHESANTQYHLFSADWASVGQDAPDYHWHHLGTISYTTATDENHAFLFAEGIPGPSAEVHSRVWVGVYSSGSSLLPYYSMRLIDAEFVYSNDAAAYAQTVEDDRGYRNIEKNYSRIDFVHNNLGAAGRQWTITYSIDGGAFQTDLEDANGNGDGVLDGTGKTSSMFFPAGTSGKTLVLKLVPASTGQTSTAPEIEAFTVVSQLRPDPVKMLPVDLYLADGMVNLSGAFTATVKSDLSQLRTWDSQAAELTVVDSEGTSRSMVILPSTFQVNQINDLVHNNKEYVVSMVLAET